MKRNSLFLVLYLVIILLVACTAAQLPSPRPQSPNVPQTQPQSNVQQPAPVPISEKPAQGISPEIKDLLDKATSKVKNMHYLYKGSQTGDNFYEFFVIDNKIKYKPALAIRTLDRNNSFDSIFIDKVAKTAEAYCEARNCIFKGKKADLDYNDYYIPTIFDWMTFKSARKLSDEVIDDRSTWKIETDQGTIWIDTFYGIPLKAESGGITFRFQQIAVNSIQESDVTPQT